MLRIQTSIPSILCKAPYSVDLPMSLTVPCPLSPFPHVVLGWCSPYQPSLSLSQPLSFHPLTKVLQFGSKCSVKAFYRTNAKGMVTSLWPYWEIVEDLGGEGLVGGS